MKKILISFIVIIILCNNIKNILSNNVNGFGPNILKELYLESNYTNMNHGSYGVVPKEVLKSVTEAQIQVEMNPDQWFRYDVFDHITKIRQQVADYIKVKNADDLVLVINASHGLNAALRSILELSSFQGKTLLYLSTAYGMVKHTIQYVVDNFNIKILEIPIKFPTTDDQIIATVENVLKSQEFDLGLCVFSHITSTPAIILPITRLIQLCKSYNKNALSIIDGAHAPGQINIEVGSYDEDIYVGNFHKWMYSPKGCAFLYVKKDVQQMIMPTTISLEGKGISAFTKAFSYQGTDDYGPWIAISKAMEWRKNICNNNDTKIIEYMHQLAIEGGKYLANAFDSELLVLDDMQGAMVNVVMPSSWISSSSEANSLINALFTGKSKYMRTWVPIFAVNAIDDSTMYVMRVSAQIYLNIEDFKRLAAAVIDIVYNKLHLD